MRPRSSSAPPLRGTPRRARRVVFVAVPPVEELDLFGAVSAFINANRLRARTDRLYEVTVLSGGPDAAITGSSGVTLVGAGSCLRWKGAIDTLVVVTGRHIDEAPPRAFIAWLRKTAPRVRRVVSVCTGAFLLAEAGLLDGRRATTHWAYAGRLAERFPAVAVSSDEIWVRHGNVYTSAGVTAGIDLALALIEEDLGAQAALDVARGMVVFLRRPGGQAQFSVTMSTRQAETPSIRQLQVWLADHLSEDLSVDRLAARVAMSPRNFARVFKQELGTTPAAYVQRLRLEHARWLLEDKQWGLERIASACGFSDVQLMRRALKRVMGITPGEYRARFRNVSV
ncbi:Transcriptional regulator [Labilithrix luteola]|uniref:Transcriptional regulator n=1 Tax=Labilithrix luteola TaxID=1391654 RepID=A0A0K1PQM4_9BACT|nr:GlxA family transcriptional regulator [Labilithrix luteola]AKU95823.1 Transcriptional regulator [Labilithrix luteola]